MALLAALLWLALFLFGLCLVALGSIGVFLVGAFSHGSKTDRDSVVSLVAGLVIVVLTIHYFPF